MSKKKKFEVVRKVLVTKSVTVEAYTEGDAEDLGGDMILNQEYDTEEVDTQSFEVNELK